MTGYHVYLGTPAGEYGSRYGLTWAECLDVVREYARAYPRWVVCVSSPRCDECGDGLTEEEQAAIDDAIHDGHAIAKCEARRSGEAS